MRLSDPAAWGISAGFHDVAGAWRPTPPHTQRAILAAMGAIGEPPDLAAGALVVRAGERVPVPERELVLEDGRSLALTGDLPADLPLGYHQLAGRSGARRLAVTPAACVPAPPGWGLAVQLYSVLSRASLGIGDLADLGTLGGLARDLGARFLLLNPLHAALPRLPQEPSPYYPSSRRFLNPIYIRVDDVPGAPPVDAEARRRLGEGRLVDRDEVYTAKVRILERAWDAVGGRRATTAALRRQRLARGPELTEFATFCAIAEADPRPWREWPAGLRSPASAGVREFADAHRARVDFHEWVQLQADAQLEAAGRRGPGLVADVAVGVHPDGADAWAFQDSMATGISVGAPPDPFNSAGQDWGLPPFNPWRLRAAGFEPWISTLRAAFRHSAGIRVDHVMGLFRLFWIPAGGGPADGAYVQYPDREMLDLLALESVRAGGWVVGEDLGTVEERVRNQLAAGQVLSYRLAWFEPGPVAGYPENALAALTTHDLPTLAGVWSGTDPMPEVRARLAEVLGLDASAEPAEVARRAHRWLASSAARQVTATLEDAALVQERPNRPGTVNPSNWSRRLPEPLEAMARDPVLLAIAAELGARRID